MDSNQILDEIRDINLSYMLLAKQMLREDRVSAMYRLGINQDIADILEKWQLQICCCVVFALMIA